MYYYKTTIQYEGTNYSGFQWQKGIHTIQSEFNSALYNFLDGNITTVAASRTDSGVHAREQIVKISSSSQIDLSTFLNTFNSMLAKDIRCLNIEPCEGLFRPGSAAISKEYRYFFTNRPKVSKLESKFIANISNALDLDLIQKCIQLINGRHDFCNFYSSGSNVKSSIRNISACELSEINPNEIFSTSDLFQIPIELTHCFEFKIEANGFLKQMIRHLISALWMVGSSKITIEEFLNLLEGPKTLKQKWKVAPPNGLFLYRINYHS